MPGEPEGRWSGFFFCHMLPHYSTRHSDFTGSLIVLNCRNDSPFYQSRLTFRRHITKTIRGMIAVFKQESRHVKFALQTIYAES